MLLFLIGYVTVDYLIEPICLCKDCHELILNSSVRLGGFLVLLFRPLAEYRMLVYMISDLPYNGSKNKFLSLEATRTMCQFLDSHPALAQ